MSRADGPTRLLVFGGGRLGRTTARLIIEGGGAAAATSRDAARRDALAAQGMTAVDPGDADALGRAVARCSALLVTAPPDADGCPGLRALEAHLAGDVWPDWIGYVSSTAVYGDRDGGWAFEDDPLNAATIEGARRVRAEREWLELGRGLGLTVQVFRLPALYGPGRSPFDRLRTGTARRVRKPGQVFNRIHEEDAARGFLASMARPRPGGVYTLCDDEPCPADEVIEWAADRLGLPQPPEVDWTDPSVSDEMRRFYRDSKRLSNARAKAELGWRPRWPGYREGLEAVLAAEDQASIRTSPRTELAR
jgi:nucleoside-diphosphate-sugar epimerase